MENEHFKALIKKAKSNNQNKTLQKVTPVKIKKNKEVQFSFYLEKNMLKELKLKAIRNDVSIKKIITDAIKNYMETN